LIEYFGMRIVYI